MSTLFIDSVRLPDGSLRLRCDRFPGWRGPKQHREDRRKVEANLRKWQTDHTDIVWCVLPAGDLDHLGFEERS